MAPKRPPPPPRRFSLFIMYGQGTFGGVAFSRALLSPIGFLVVRVIWVIPRNGGRSPKLVGVLTGLPLNFQRAPEFEKRCLGPPVEPFLTPFLGRRVPLLKRTKPRRKTNKRVPTYSNLSTEGPRCQKSFLILPTVDGRNPAPLGSHEKPLLVGIYREIILLGFARWCEIVSSVLQGRHERMLPRQRVGALCCEDDPH